MKSKNKDKKNNTEGAEESKDGKIGMTTPWPPFLMGNNLRNRTKGKFYISSDKPLMKIDAL